jgi:acyl-coenzyme A synthetase/AMP-(fatty) acid ligase
MVAIWDLVARRAASRHARVVVQDVCAAAVAAIPVSGAGLLAVTPAGAIHVMCVTDEIVERLADIELTVGEGPRADVSASGGPVLASDLAH